MIKFPKKLKIGGHEYEVLYPYKFTERTDLFGQADHALKQIKVTDTDGGGAERPVSGVCETFLHEILHCADDQSKAGLEERQIGCMAEALYQIFVDNPDLLGVFRREG